MFLSVDNVVVFVLGFCFLQLFILVVVVVVVLLLLLFFLYVTVTVCNMSYARLAARPP